MASAAVALVCALLLARAPAQQSVSAPRELLDDRTLSFALCPVVYQADTTPGPRGYRYLFYGNAFFINRQGYLLTAAHVLSQLRGAPPSLLLRLPNQPPRFVSASVVAIDRDHDVAILRATPNPFDAGSTFRLAALPLSHAAPTPGRAVLLAALRPFRPRDSYTLESALEERSPGEILSLEFSQLDRGSPETELFLFSHSVEPGQSGGPVLSPDTHQVVGLVEGQWLRLSPAAVAAHMRANPGAVIPIHYALALLQQKGIAWQGAEEDADVNPSAANDHESGADSAQSEVPATPERIVPFSLVPTSYPSQSLFGGEVILDALVTPAGFLKDVKLIHGENPFAEKALAAVRTWTFTPRTSDEARSQRLSIVFEFPQPYIPPRRATTHHHDDDASSARATTAALPLLTVEPTYPAAASAKSADPATPKEGSVILLAAIDAEGHIASTDIVQDLPPFTAAAIAAVHEWRFTAAPATVESTTRSAILVFTFRKPLAAGHAATD